MTCLSTALDLATLLSHSHTQCINLSRSPLVQFNPVVLAGVQTGV